MPTVFGEQAIGRAHWRQQQPRARSRQHVPDHRDGHLHLQPDVPHGRSLWMGQTGDELGAAGPRHERRDATCWAFRAPTARASSRAAGPRSSSKGRLRHGRRERELHAVLPPRSAVAVRRELQLDQEPAQHPVRRRLLSHGVEPCAGGVHHRGLRRAGRLRVRPRHHRAVRGRRSARRATARRRPTAPGPTARQRSCSAWPAAPAERCRCRTSTTCGHTRTASTSAIGGPSATTSPSTTARDGSTSRCRPGPTAASSGTTSRPTRCCCAASATCPTTAASRRARRYSPRAWAWPIASATSGSSARATA